MDISHYVDAIHDQCRPARHTKRHVKHGAVLRRVDPHTAGHRVDAFRQAALFCEPDEKRKRLVGDEVLGQICMDPSGVNSQT